MDRGNWDPAKAQKWDTPGIEALLDDRTAEKLVRELNKPQAAKPKPGPGKRVPVPHSDQDLMTQMIAKLSKVEKVCEAQRKEVKEKSARIADLESKLHTYEQSAAPEAYETLSSLQTENAELRKEVEEMKEFLHRYGVKWVGNKPQGELNVRALDQDLSGSDPRYRYNLPHEIDIRVLARRVQELNIIAEQDAGRWVAQGNMRQFKALDPVPIFFFQNGLVLKGFPFRPYSSHEAQSLLSDLLDGYFPYDLKKKYPDGIPLTVVDKTNEQFRPQDSNIRSVEDRDLGFLSKEQFLGQLPESVIKDGKVIPIKEDIARILGNEAKPQEGSGEIRSHVDDRLAAGDTSVPFTSLRIKMETGKKTLIVKLLYTDTIATLKRLLDPHSESKGRYEIRSTFPAKVFDIGDQSTMEALGLVPNYALALRSLTSS